MRHATATGQEDFDSDSDSDSASDTDSPLFGYTLMRSNVCDFCPDPLNAPPFK